MKTPLDSRCALVARQPIFDKRLTVIAHELLYRAAPELEQSVRSDGVLATARVIVDACLEIGLDRLTGAVPVHINFPRGPLVSDGSRRLERTYQELRRRQLTLIAEKVETAEEFERLRKLGFDGFQGFFLGRPELFRGRRVPTDRLATLRILAELQNPQIDAATLEPLVARDAATSYRMLRCIKSSFYGLPRSVDSLRQAIVVLGMDELRRLCAAVMLGKFDDRPAHLLLDTLVRARMCELLAKAGGVRETGPYFMTGLFSTLEALLGVPLDEALHTVTLAEPVVRALLQGEGDLGRTLRCVRDYESGRWDALRDCGLSNKQLRDAYVDALAWADGTAGFIGVD